MITTRSETLFEQAGKHLVGGVGSGTRSPRSGWLPAPVFVRSGEGAWLDDVDDNRYLDYVMGQGPLILGHRPAAVIEEVTRTLEERGSLVSLAHDLEGEAAAAITDRMPAVDLVLRFEGHYHGWSDAIHWSAHPSADTWGAADAPTVLPGSTGIPGAVGETLLVERWNDFEALERAFRAHGDRMAAVITEPILGNCGGIMPAAGYLERMRELATEAGVLVIFDEVLTGFRIGPGGAQGMFGIDPDLTVMAKAIGAGFPVAALGGSREVMEQAADGRTMHGGTYNSSPLVCAAVIAACRETGSEGFYEHLNARGARLAEGLVEAAEAAGIDACWSGVGALFQLWFSPEPPNDYREANAIVAGSPFFALYRELRDRGVLIQPPQEGLWLMSGAHTDADIDRTLEAAADAMPAVAAALAEGSVGPMGGLR